MPFPDELTQTGVEVSPYAEAWAAEGRDLAVRTWSLVPNAVAVDHIGSTAVPGLAAKDCLDLMAQVPGLDDLDLTRLEQAGFRRRPEPWNQAETTDGVVCPKLVFAPPVGGRRLNLHVRVVGGPNVRFALLFRDYLRADDGARDAWGAFKQDLAQTSADLNEYGTAKAAAYPTLMADAEAWAEATSWRP